MNTNLFAELNRREIDVDGAMKRFSDNEELYISCLADYLRDDTVAMLEKAIDTEQWDDAFTAAHALKGVAANMGFIRLSAASARMVILIRNGQLDDVGASLEEIRAYQNVTVSAVKRCMEAIKSNREENVL